MLQAVRVPENIKDERLECGAPWQLISGCVSCLERKVRSPIRGPLHQQDYYKKIVAAL